MHIGPDSQPLVSSYLGGEIPRLHLARLRHVAIGCDRLRKKVKAPTRPVQSRWYRQYQRKYELKTVCTCLLSVWYVCVIMAFYTGLVLSDASWSMVQQPKSKTILPLTTNTGLVVCAVHINKQAVAQTGFLTSSVRACPTDDCEAFTLLRYDAMTLQVNLTLSKQ